MITRNFYIDKISPFLGKRPVKVVTGMRRAGKSYFLRSLIEHLVRQGTPRKRIIYVDKESLDFDAIRDYRDLQKYVATMKTGSGKTTVIVDEVQSVEGWERAVADWSGREDFDVLVSGSNAGMLSGELATLIAGRYIEFPIFPLSFGEFRQFHDLQDSALEEAFRKYMRFGGLPGLREFGPLSENVFLPFVSGIYSTIMLKDVVSRHQIRNPALLEAVARFLFDNIGNPTTSNRIHAFLKNQKISVGVPTILNYMQWFEDAHLTRRVRLYDIKGKRHLEINEKHFLTDLGLRAALLGHRDSDISGTLENIICMELLRRGWQVSVGRMGSAEVDFVAVRGGEKLYVQVAYLLASKSVVEREIAPLLDIRDNYPKLLLTLDRDLGNDVEGIRRLYIPDWLLE